jgi:hypothetical protein
MSVAALSDDERASCYEIAAVIYKDNTSANLHNSFGVQVQLVELNVIQDALEDALNNLGDTGITKVRAIVEEWDPIADFSGKIENGSIGCVTGITIDWDAIKATIKRRFCLYVPVMHLMKAISMVQDREPDQPQTVIGIMRG